MLYFQEEIENNNLSEKQTRWLRRYESEIEHVPRRNIPFKLQSLAFIELIDEEQPNIMRKLSKKFTREEQIKLLYDIHRDITLKKVKYGGERWTTLWDQHISNIFNIFLTQLKLLPTMNHMVWLRESTPTILDVFGVDIGTTFIRSWKTRRQTNKTDNTELRLRALSKAVEVQKLRCGPPRNKRRLRYQQKPYIIDRIPSWTRQTIFPDETKEDHTEEIKTKFGVYSYNRRLWKDKSQLKYRLHAWSSYQWDSFHL